MKALNDKYWLSISIYLFDFKDNFFFNKCIDCGFFSHIESLSLTRLHY